MGNQNVQLIGVENRTLDQKLNVVTRSGLATDDVLLDNSKNSTMDWVRKSTAKSPTLEI